MDIKYYDSESDFSNNICNLSKSKSYSITIDDLYRYAIFYGSPSVKSNVLLMKYKKSIVKSFLEVSDGDVVIKNLEFLESSEKVTISYYIGMIFAQLVAEKEFNIKQLFHIQPTDSDKNNNNYSVITTNYPQKTKIPDLVGINSSGNGLIMFEAKGSTLSNNLKKQVKKGVEQLEAVSSIELIRTQSSAPSCISGSFNKKHSNNPTNDPNSFVVATAPDKNTKKLLSYVVDPISEGDLKLVLNYDYYLYKHYSIVLSTLVESNRTTIGNYIYCNLDELGLKVGVLKSIYDIFEDSINKEYPKINHEKTAITLNNLNIEENFKTFREDFVDKKNSESSYEGVTRILNQVNFEEDLEMLRKELRIENISLGLDGIFVGRIE